MAQKRNVRNRISSPITIGDVSVNGVSLYPGVRIDLLKLAKITGIAKSDDLVQAVNSNLIDVFDENNKRITNKKKAIRYLQTGTQHTTSNTSLVTEADVLAALRASNATKDLGNGDITNVDEVVGATTVTFSAEVNNGDSGAAATIDWSAGQKQRITLTATCTFTFTDPIGPSNILIVLVQDAGGTNGVNWPGTVNWTLGTPPSLTAAGGSVDIVSFYFDGTNYYGVASLSFS